MKRETEMHSILMSLFVLAGLLLPTWIATQWGSEALLRAAPVSSKDSFRLKSGFQAPGHESQELKSQS
jgi:hypothetical protein